MRFSLTDGCLVEAFAFVQKLRHILLIGLQQMILVEIFDTWEKEEEDKVERFIIQQPRASINCSLK